MAGAIAFFEGRCVRETRACGRLINEERSPVVSVGGWENGKIYSTSGL
ncbi:MAG: hypothetical protein ABI262_19415 [Microcoleus sp.]